MQNIKKLWMFIKVVLLLIVTTVAVYGGILLIIPIAILGMATVFYKLSETGEDYCLVIKNKYATYVVHHSVWKEDVH